MKKFLFIFFFSFLPVALFSQIKLYTLSGNVIECQSIQKKRFGFEYVKINTTDGSHEYIPNTKIDHIEYSNGEIEYISGSSNNQSRRKNPKDFTYLSPHYISLNIGPAVPYYVLASTPGPYSIVGVNTELDATFYPFGGSNANSFLGGVGIGLLAGYTYNPFDGTQHQGFISNNLLADTAANISNLNVHVGGWNNFYIMGGAGYNNSFNRIMLDYKLLVGGLYSIYPKAGADYTSDGISKTSIFKASSFDYMIGLYGCIRYFLTRKFSLKANISFLLGGSTFEELTREDYVDNHLVGQYVVKPFTNTAFLNFNVTFGVAYTIGR